MKLKTCFTYDLRDSRGFSIKLIKRLILDFNYRVIVLYRIAILLKHTNLLRFFGKLILVRIARIPGVEINTRIPIGKGFSLQHAHDIVIGYGSVIKENVTVYNGVTIGAKYKISKENINEKDGNKYPTINENVIIFPGAKIIGNIEIGANSIIGTNAVVLNSFPPNSIIVGMPAKRIKDLRDYEI